MKLAVLGGGAWGTALSISLAAHHRLSLWLRDRGQADRLRTSRVNQRYLPGCLIPDSVEIHAELAAALDSCELVLLATPTAGLRPTLKLLGESTDAPTVWLCKGFEAQSALLPHQVAAQELPAKSLRGVLSGPSFAAEVARGLPAALTLASNDRDFAARTSRLLHDNTLRIYSSDDQVGVEVAGAVKNVIAIAAGISDGLELGNSARAALVTRGLAEITRLGLELGGRLETFMGLAGVGDLILTCSGELSRNRKVGAQLARDRPLASILSELGHVAEGVYTARAVDALARKLRVEMPITRAVCRIMDDRIPARTMVRELLQRDPKPETR